MTLKEFSLDYAKCSREELQDFMKARGIRLKEDKQACVTALQRADSEASFRFEDLPGELRNRVYYELLLLPSSKNVRRTEVGHKYRTITQVARGCYPHILATSSSIRDESSSILYGANTVQIDIERRISSHPQTRGCEEFHQLSVLRLTMQRRWPDALFARLRTEHENWPSCLLKFQNVRIRMTTEVARYRATRGRYDVEITHTLYALASFLQRSTELKTLSVFADNQVGSDLVSAPTLSEVLYPLARLSPKLKLEGFTHYPALGQQLRLVAMENQELYQTNVLHYAFLLRDESEAYKAMTDISNNRTNVRQHIKLRPQMLRVFNQTFKQPEDERRLLECADSMAKFLTRAYKEEAAVALSRASGFWLATLRRFEAPHKERVKHFPEQMEETE